MVNDVAYNRLEHPLTTCWFRRRGRVVYVRRESNDVLPRPTQRALLHRASSPRRIREGYLRYVGVLAADFCSLLVPSFYCFLGLHWEPSPLL